MIGDLNLDANFDRLNGTTFTSLSASFWTLQWEEIVRQI